MGETIINYDPYNLWNPQGQWNNDLIAESLPYTIRGNSDIGTAVSKELIDTITKEVIEQLRNDYNCNGIKVIKEKYHLKHR